MVRSAQSVVHAAHACATGASWLALAAAMVAGILSSPGRARSQDYIQEDAKLSGKTMYFLQEDSGKDITVVQGSFRLQIGKHVMTGDGAVMWIQETPAGETVRRKMTIYIEGHARVVEPDGAATADRTILVRADQEGNMTASGKSQAGKLADLPIYARAVAVRKQVESPLTNQPAPPLVQMAPTTRPSATTRPTTSPATQPAKKHGEAQNKVVLPVEFQAQNVLMKDLPTGPPGSKKSNMRVVVLKGNIYISQGAERSEMFLEMRAQSAVIFIEKNVPIKDVRSPLSSHLPSFGQNDNVSGVYLEGDVIVSRGERVMQAPKAYYDFTTDRATIVDPVFRTIQEERNIPIYIRAREAKVLSAREIQFNDAQVTTSDFQTPSYAIAAKKVIFRDLTPYDAKGEPIGEQKLEAELTKATYRIEDIPAFYWPFMSDDISSEEEPLRRLTVGHNGQFGTGFESEWDFFRLFGLIRPEGVRGGLDLDYYSHASLMGVNFQYSRRSENIQYSGYAIASYVYDNKAEDRFSSNLPDIPAPHDRGRVLTRNKQFLPGDWELQCELSYLSDRNFLREFYREEFWAGKEQETLLYAKKQRDNWAFTALLQYRLNDFQTQTESYPDLSFYLLGEPLADGHVTYFNEDHLGIKRYQPDDGSGLQSSDPMARGDTRNELDVPLKAGPVNITPYATGRLTGWSDQPSGGKDFRPYGQVGVKNNMDIWRTYDDVQSRLWDINRLKHVITPEVVGWVASTGGVTPDEIFPMDPGIEEGVTSTSGASFGVYQRLQTKRGEEGKQQTVDWMRLDIVASVFDKTQNSLPSDGRFFFARPEDSLARNAVDVDYTWNISDATAFLADANYDMDSEGFGRIDAGFAVQRDPRLRYYLGVRRIRDESTTVGTFGFNYKLSQRYSLGFFEQYDFDSVEQKNLLTTLSLIRKFERWYGAISFEYDRTQGSFGAYFTFWPEGAPEAKIGSGRASPLGTSSQN
jgi:hypothetical protein